MEKLEKEIMEYLAQLDEYHKRAVWGFVKHLAEAKRS